MSEYQYVAFRAIDAPVSTKNLAFMRQQSTRAEITPWSFDNEYQWGDFRGNVREMLRRGYDFHLHYADFGVRTLCFRLPSGFPDPKAAKCYLGEDALQFTKDKAGAGGILVVEPQREPGDFVEYFDAEKIIDSLLPLRSEILAGDLRPLYIAHLAVSLDEQHDPDDATEGPVPAGLANLTIAQKALAEFYGLPNSWLAAAAAESPALPKAHDDSAGFDGWVVSQSQQAKDRWLAELIRDASPALRAELLAEFRRQHPAPPWPIVRPDRAMSQLEEAAARIERELKKKSLQDAERKRRKKLADIVSDPKPFLAQSTKLVAEGGTAAYEQAAKLLAEIREALADTRDANLAERHAQKLRADNPTRTRLTGALRRNGFLK